ncbi:hypothetical protein LQT26_25710 [Escherichia coli]|nr:hypothetical protein LQT26_25710 [Escherichia coli]
MKYRQWNINYSLAGKPTPRPCELNLQLLKQNRKSTMLRNQTTSTMSLASFLKASRSTHLSFVPGSISCDFSGFG